MFNADVATPDQREQLFYRTSDTMWTLPGECATTTGWAERISHTAATTPVIQCEPYQGMNLGFSLTGWVCYHYTIGHYTTMWGYGAVFPTDWWSTSKQRSQESKQPSFHSKDKSVNTIIKYINSHQHYWKDLGKVKTSLANCTPVISILAPIGLAFKLLSSYRLFIISLTGIYRHLWMH